MTISLTFHSTQVSREWSAACGNGCGGGDGQQQQQPAGDVAGDARAAQCHGDRAAHAEPGKAQPEEPTNGEPGGSSAISPAFRGPITWATTRQTSSNCLTFIPNIMFLLAVSLMLADFHVVLLAGCAGDGARLGQLAAIPPIETRVSTKISAG